MKTFYCVTSSFYDSGRVVAAITDTVEAYTKPENHHTEKRDRDIYTDWFGSLGEAQQFVKGAKKA
jgi:hypothetical protein